MDSHVVWVRETAELRSWLERLDPGPVGFDTESDSLHRYPERVCLIQLSIPGHDLLIDPLADVDPKELETLLADPDRRKVLHGSDYDLRVLMRDFGLRVRGLFDTMIAARLLGESAVGLAALLEGRFGVRVDKRYQRADWSRRPLPAEMSAYAALDTRYLVRLAGELEAELDRLGRIDWAREEFELLERVTWSANNEDPESYRRVKGSGALDPRGLAALRELYRLRERSARERGRPPFKILGNETLLRLARRRPTERGELIHIGGLPRRWRQGAAAERLVEILREVEGLPPDALPVVRRRTRRDSCPTRERSLKRLKAHRDERARELGIEPSVLAPRALLESIVDRVRSGEDGSTTPDLRRWQHAILAPAIELVEGD